jgi:hypothetical protein
MVSLSLRCPFNRLRLPQQAGFEQVTRVFRALPKACSLLPHHGFSLINLLAIRLARISLSPLIRFPFMFPRHPNPIVGAFNGLNPQVGKCRQIVIYAGNIAAVSSFLPR